MKSENSLLSKENKLNISNNQSIFVIILLCIIILISIIFLMHYIYTKASKPDEETTFIIGSTKDIFQIIFFIVAGSITILSYIQAKKTLFTPIKTEVFKMQVKAFEDILAYFQNKNESSFLEQFDFNFMMTGNAELMLNNYVEHFFSDKIKIKKEALDELNESFVGGVIKTSLFKKHFKKVEYFEQFATEENLDTKNQVDKLDTWKSFEHENINYTQKFQDEKDKLNQLIASPLIPNELKSKLEIFESKLLDNLAKIGEVLSVIAQELPQKFPSPESLGKLDVTGMYSRYIDEAELLEPTAKEILVYIRQYLKVDTLIK